MSRGRNRFGDAGLNPLLCTNQGSIESRRGSASAAKSLTRCLDRPLGLIRTADRSICALVFAEVGSYRAPLMGSLGGEQEPVNVICRNTQDALELVRALRVWVATAEGTPARISDLQHQLSQFGNQVYDLNGRPSMSESSEPARSANNYDPYPSYSIPSHRPRDLH